MGARLLGAPLGASLALGIGLLIGSPPAPADSTPTPASDGNRSLVGWCILNGGPRTSAGIVDPTSTDFAWIDAWCARPFTGQLRLHSADDTLESLTLGWSEATILSGDWDGRGEPAWGIVHDGRWWLDLNRNGRCDRDDLWIEAGEAGDQPLVGDWDGDGKSDLGLIRPQFKPRDGQTIGARAFRHGWSSPRSMRWETIPFAGEVGDQPLVGDPHGLGRDMIGIARQGSVWLNLRQRRPGENAPDLELPPEPGMPFLVDRDGDGRDEWGWYHSGRWTFERPSSRGTDAEPARIDDPPSGTMPLVARLGGMGSSRWGQWLGVNVTTP